MLLLMLGCGLTDETDTEGESTATCEEPTGTAVSWSEWEPQLDGCLNFLTFYDVIEDEDGWKEAFACDETAASGIDWTQWRLVGVEVSQNPNASIRWFVETDEALDLGLDEPTYCEGAQPSDVNWHILFPAGEKPLTQTHCRHGGCDGEEDYP